MKQALVGGRWNVWLPDSIAEWDAISGDPTVPSGWEIERMTSMQQHLRYGDTFFDIGTEHGWLAAVIAREFVGPENMVLIEPSPELWVNIRKTWDYNGFAKPAGFWPGFVGEECNPGSYDLNDKALYREWPAICERNLPEVGAMAYRSLLNPDDTIPTITVDQMVKMTGLNPIALNIDIEGAEMLALQGASEWMEDGAGVRRFIWVSIHEDLLLNFGHTLDDFLAFQKEWSGHWTWQHLATDHEQHHFGQTL